MGYIKINVQRIGTKEDLKCWEDRMMTKGKCWNKFCLGIYEQEELVGAYVTKEGNDKMVYLVPLCLVCYKDGDLHDILVNDNHLLLV